MSKPGTELYSYSYRPLEHTDSIRLLELLPDNLEDGLRVCLFQVRKSKNPIYEAFSYTWGDAALVSEIYEVLSDTTVRITQNLGVALKDLRHTTKARTFWIDAICIDQSNVKERGHQVALMGDIYRNAENVVVWLGSCVSESPAELEAIDTLARIKQTRTEGYDNLTNSVGYLTLLGRKLKDVLNENVLHTFLIRPWFERVWTVQEYVLGKEVQLYVGPYTMSLRSFHDAMDLLWMVFNPQAPVLLVNALYPDDLRFDLRETQRKVSLAWELVRLRREHRRSKQSLARCVLDIARHRECTDPRDRLYAMLGLAGITSIMPDYNATYQQVCLTFATHCLLKGCLILLHDCGRPKTGHPHTSPCPATISPATLGESEPSFVPDISYDAAPHSIFALAERRALAYAGVLHRPKVGLIEARSISISGVAIDKIAKSLNFTETPSAWEFKGPDLSLAELTWKSLIFYLTRYSASFIIKTHAEKATESKFWYEKRRRDREVKQGTAANGSKSLTVQGYYTKDDCEDEESFVGTVLKDDHTNELIPPILRQSELHNEMLRKTARVFNAHSNFETELDYIGVGPAELEEGDQVVIFDGGETPFVLREVSIDITTGQKRWKLIGDAYLLGWMDGDYFGLDIVDEADVPIASSNTLRDGGTEGHGVDSGFSGSRKLVRTTFVLS